MLYFCSTAPSAPPDSFSIVSIGARNVTLSWTNPEENERNGVITGYMVSCADGDSTTSNARTTSSLTATVGELTPYLLYTCRVTASTSAGVSPAATLNFTTATAGKFTPNIFSLLEIILGVIVPFNYLLTQHPFNLHLYNDNMLL